MFKNKKKELIKKENIKTLQLMKQRTVSEFQESAYKKTLTDFLLKL